MLRVQYLTDVTDSKIFLVSYDSITYLENEAPSYLNKIAPAGFEKQLESNDAGSSLAVVIQSIGTLVTQNSTSYVDTH